MKIHILGICGTFMGSLALLARELGHDVSGSDMNIYPPMSTQLQDAGITILPGYAASNLQPAPDLVIIGNAMSRGNPCVEYILNEDLRRLSGPQWLSETVLPGRHVLAVSGTHGKTTTTSMIAWILEAAGKQPGFLIGGVAENFGLSARLGNSNLFVIEADEYDTAFFDKRSKFIHYRPKTLVINNIEYDHADIFPDLAAIRREFHHLIRTLPGRGQVIIRAGDAEIQKVLEQGIWTPVVTFGTPSGEWLAEPVTGDYSHFYVSKQGKHLGEIRWPLLGHHNADNALAAIAAAANAGVNPAQACEVLANFKSVKRRLQRIGQINGISVYDDFAHHPTAIAATIRALRQHIGKQRITAVLELRSNTMKLGVYKEQLASALQEADQVHLARPGNLSWDLAASMEALGQKLQIHHDVESIISTITRQATAGDHILIMSNGGFDNIHQRLLNKLGH